MIKAGKELEDLQKNKVLEIIEAWILIPLENEAFNSFGNVLPTDTEKIMEVQIKQKAVTLFRNTWANIVFQGKQAQDQLLVDETTEEIY